ncbi:hypothetical protein PAXINDRAFT_97947 [Paxillus involutus ATCC 200175]|nr:hypothetical protein PAXINDRAFT_97947 [Paxillus involutus ATCC 200175]
MTAPALPETGVGSTLYEPGSYADGYSDFEEVYSAPLIEFFSAFKNFTLNPNAPSTDEFNRLIRVSTFSKKEARQLRRDFNDALVDEFVMAYGKDNTLYAWCALCDDIGIDPIPATLLECQTASAVQNSFVNIIDLLHAKGTRTKVQRFGSLEELAKYTAAKKRYFPLHKARGSLLRELLRPLSDVVSKKQRRRRKREVPQDVESSQQQKESGQAGGKRKRRNRARRRAKLARPTAAATETASAPPANEVSV